MTTSHEDLRKILNYVNVIALVAIGAYVWTDYNGEHPTPLKPRVSHLQSPIIPTGTQQLITVRAIGVTDGVTVLDETNTPRYDLPAVWVPSLDAGTTVSRPWSRGRSWEALGVRPCLLITRPQLYRPRSLERNHI